MCIRDRIVTDIKGNKVDKLERTGNSITAVYKDGNRYLTTKESEDSLRKILQESGIKDTAVQIDVKSNSETSFVDILINVVPTIIVIAFLMFLFKQARGAQDSVFSFGQSKSKRYTKKMTNVTFKDVAGVNEAKLELEEIVD